MVSSRALAKDLTEFFAQNDNGMNNEIFQYMQKAVDIVPTSPHPANKIAATLAGTGPDGQEFSVSATNFWPPGIATHIGLETRIGNASGTIHAETACILKAPATEGAALFITDLPCPNCVKNMAEAGIKSLYIDHKGFDKDFAIRRGHHFEHMSMQICEKAGISVYRIFRKDQKLEMIFEPLRGYVPLLEKPPHIEKISGELSPAIFSFWIKTERQRYNDESYAVAFAENSAGEKFAISAEPHPVIGYTSDTMEEPGDKYSFILQPVNRLLMTAARKGLTIQNGFLYSSIVPTARELVNVTGAELDHMIIGNQHAARDEWGPMALMQLEEAGILTIS